MYNTPGSKIVHAESSDSLASPGPAQAYLTPPGSASTAISAEAVTPPSQKQPELDTYPSFHDRELPEVLRWRGLDPASEGGVEPPLLRYGVLIPDYAKCMARRACKLQMCKSKFWDGLTEEKIAEVATYYQAAWLMFRAQIKTELPWVIPATVMPLNVTGTSHKSRVLYLFTNEEHERRRQDFTRKNREETAVNYLRKLFDLPENTEARWYFDNRYAFERTGTFRLEDWWPEAEGHSSQD